MIALGGHAGPPLHAKNEATEKRVVQALRGLGVSVVRYATGMIA